MRALAARCAWAALLAASAAAAEPTMPPAGALAGPASAGPAPVGPATAGSATVGSALAGPATAGAASARAATGVPAGEASGGEAERYRDELLARQTGAMAVLGGWSVGSLAVGAGLVSLGRTPFVRAVGVQQIAWGAIDLTIAALSYRGIRADRSRREPLGHWHDERRKLRTILAVNVALDVLYVAAGVALNRLGKREAVRGAGAGVVPQGAFLLVFDSAFLLSL